MHRDSGDALKKSLFALSAFFVNKWPYDAEIKLPII